MQHAEMNRQTDSVLVFIRHLLLHLSGTSCRWLNFELSCTDNCEPVLITVYWKQTVKHWVIIRLSNAEVVSPSLFKLRCWFDGLWTTQYSSVAVLRQRFQSSVLHASDETLLLVSVHLQHSTLTLCKQNMKCTIIVVVHWALSGAKTHKQRSVMA